MRFRFCLLCGALLAFFGVAKECIPLTMRSTDLVLSTGNPSLVTMENHGTRIPVWSLSGGTVGQSVSGIVSGLPAWSAGVRVEILVTTEEPAPAGSEFVFRVHLSQFRAGASFPLKRVVSVPVRSPVPDKPHQIQKICLESFYAVDPEEPLHLQIQREPGDPSDTFLRPVGLILAQITPLSAPPKAEVVQNVKGYNSWPMMQALGTRLVCTYSRGSGHSIGEDKRAVYARVSDDFGKTWSPEVVVADTPGAGEVTVAKGLDEKGAMLLWVRRIGSSCGLVHDLYRTKDGFHFERIASPKWEVWPMQVTDVFSVPNVGLMALWFSGNYKDEPAQSWGTIVSQDGGLTWTQRVVESGLGLRDWPTEQSAVYVGKGRILAIARTENLGSTTDRAQFQLESFDAGKTWTRRRTNIGEVAASTPSLLFDEKSGKVYNYYYERGRGVLRRRVVDLKFILGNPLGWPDSAAAALGSAVQWDAGNVNATKIGGRHFLTYYSGKAPDTAVYVVEDSVRK